MMLMTCSNPNCNIYDQEISGYQEAAAAKYSVPMQEAASFQLQLARSGSYHWSYYVYLLKASIYESQ